MKLTDILNKKHIIADLKSRTKRGVMEELCQALAADNPGLDQTRLMEVLVERERLGSTGIGDGIAIPHGKTDQIDELQLAFGRSVAGVDFDSLDGKPAHLFFLVVAPENSAGSTSRRWPAFRACSRAPLFEENSWRHLTPLTFMK